MKLTPLDLQQKQFRKVRLGGIDEKEVRVYLEQCAAEMEELARKVIRQDEELRRRELRINEFRDREHLLQSTLTTAQKLADEMKSHTRKEADIVLSDAELQAEKIIANAQSRRMQLISEIDELKRSKASFLQQMTAILETHKMVVDQIRGEARASESSPSSGDNLSFLAPPAAKKK
jgi:cell division initiation protein